MTRPNGPATSSRSPVMSQGSRCCAQPAPLPCLARSERQQQLIALLRLEGSLSIAELASRMVVDPTSIYPLADLLGARGVVERLAVPGVRGTLLRLTRKALEEMYG